MSKYADLPHPHPTPTVAPETTPDTLGRDGAAFILDEATEVEPRWGKGAEVIWARGESLMIVGPPGVGKTTIAGQVVAGLIGVCDEVLGMPVIPAQRVLYLAMDRPRQMRRAMARRFTQEHRQALTDRLVVRPGPLPTDLAKAPDQIVRLAQHYGCDVVVIDSLKDAATKLSDDEAASNVNRAIQFCNAADIDLLILHHQRKAQGGSKPTKLEDVYGNTWITAGAGSVVLLWGEAGSELVELTHLKQPAEPVGPWTIEHDHHRGESRISRGFDALAFLRNRGEAGATVSDAAQAEHGAPQASGSAKWKKTERRLRALVQGGHARCEQRVAVGVPQRYFAMDNPHGHTPSAAPMDALMDNPLDTHGH